LELLCVLSDLGVKFYSESHLRAPRSRRSIYSASHGVLGDLLAFNDLDLNPLNPLNLPNLRWTDPEVGTAMH
jgi:hypothetical protein